jgi:three-Cys-motif partner protein
VHAAPEFFDERREWSRWKHEILRRYLPKFAGILGSRNRIIYYVDGFAGAGTYRQDPPTPGSPLIAAQLAATLAASGRWLYALRCINVEPNPQLFGELSAATGEYEPSIVKNIQGTFQDSLSEILTLVGDSPALFFLDPFGYKGIESRTIAPLAERSRRATTELLVNFNVSKIDRDAGWLDSYAQRVAPGFIASLNQLMGTDAWKAIITAGLSKEERDERLAALYKNSLQTLFSGIVAQYPVRTLNGRLKYYILHVTRHQRGSREMSEVIYRVEHAYANEKARVEGQRGRQLSFDQVLAPPPSLEESDAELAVRLAESIYALGRERGCVTFGSIQDELAVSWFGLAVERHYRAACKLLIRQGKIRGQKEAGIKDSTPLNFV